MLVIDFETRSRVDLKLHGGDLYCRDPSTDIICMAATDGNHEWLWTPAMGKLPGRLVSKIQLAEYIAAHNARFDQQIWEYIAVSDYGFPEVPAERWYCTSAQARVNGLPAGLDEACRALKTGHKKSHAGHSLIKKLCIPQENGAFNNDPALLKQMGDYCLADVLATQDLVNGCRQLSGQEHQDWLNNERINDRGIKVDRGLAMCASQYRDRETTLRNDELCKLTSGIVDKSTQYQRITKWVLPKLPSEVEELAVVYKKGKRKHSLAKDVRRGILDRADAQEITISDEVYNVLACLDEASASSVLKFDAMLNRSTADDPRVYGSLMYAGAQTLRYSSRGLQLHNMRRDAHDEATAIAYRNSMMAGHQVADVMQTLAKLLRPALIPEDGNVFVVGDWSAIEGRGLPWLADSPDALQKLELFKQLDNDPSLPDIYERAWPADRQIGKVKELSLGFGGAAGAFNSMARNYGVYLPEHEVDAHIKDWRVKNSWAEPFWNTLERAAMAAIKSPNACFDAGKVSYTFNPDLMDGTLHCMLPSGTVLTYPQARIEYVDTPWGDTKPQITALKGNWSTRADADEWSRFRLWRGLLAENATQGECAALLRWAIAQTDKVILHVHDELVLEVPEDDAQYWKSNLEQVMESGPTWAAGLPLKAPAKIMARYGK